jgi:LmbE family N-acetylglucosaminyl deacetylase
MLVRSTAELPALSTRVRRLLAVFPHPDDESYGPGGTLARAGRDADTAAALLCLTRGEASSMGPARGQTPTQVAELREGRLTAVAEVLGLDALVVDGLPDGRVARCPLDAVARRISEALDALRPHVVIGHDPRGVNAHPDHVATHWAIRHALLGREGVRFAMMAYPTELAEAVKPRLLFATPEDEIDAVLHLTEEEIEAKEAALRIHEAFITLREDGDAEMIRRPPVERYDFLGEDCSPPLDDLFRGIESQ